jgi:hypothetical protein
MNEENLHIDESWKNQVDKEKATAAQNNEKYHEPNFQIFLTSLLMQAMIAMGKMENPVTKKRDKNMEQARFMIDTISILKAKTQGNLTEQEQKMVDEALSSLRMIYVQEKNL